MGSIIMWLSSPELGRGGGLGGGAMRQETGFVAAFHFIIQSKPTKVH